MATGDQNDITARLQALIPFSWFPQGLVPLRDAVLQGIANSLSYLYTMLAYVRLQTRIATATDGFLDLIALDFFGAGLQRLANESDTAYRARIFAALLRERCTRHAVILVLQQLTGRTPVICEPMQTADTGAYSEPGWGYSSAGFYGSRLLPFQAFVQAFRPKVNGVPFVGGYGVAVAGYGVGQAEYVSFTQIGSAVTDSAILAAINSVRPVATRIWTLIKS